MRSEVPARAKEGGWSARESSGDRRVSTPARLTATGTSAFLYEQVMGLYKVCPAYARGTARCPFTFGRGVFPLVSPDIAERRSGFACSRHRVMLAAGRFRS